MTDKEEIIGLKVLIATLEERIASQKEAVLVALSTAEQAVRKAESAAEKRFDSVNEFRETLADQQRTLMPRSEAEIRLVSMEDKIKTMSAVNNISIGKSSGGHEMWAYIIGAIGVLFGLITLFLNFNK